MEIYNLIPHIESLFFASDKPLTTLEIVDLINNAFSYMDEKVQLDQVEASLEGIVEKYKAEFYPFEVRQSGGGWQFLTKKDYHKTIAQLNGDKFLKKLSSAAMETLGDPCKTLLLLYYWEEKSQEEIAAQMGFANAATVKSKKYTCKKILAKILKEKGF